MARAPDQRVEQARKLYAKGLKLIEIAGTLGVPEGTVRSWKNRYDWDNATLQKNKRNVAKKKGGQPGNKNAEGHGGTGPPGNKNAIKTGESMGWKLGTNEEKAVANPSMRCSAFPEKSMPGASRHACPSLA